jgi:hypothetical protein
LGAKSKWAEIVRISVSHINTKQSLRCGTEDVNRDLWYLMLVQSAYEQSVYTGRIRAIHRLQKDGPLFIKVTLITANASSQMFSNSDQPKDITP